MLIFDEEKEKVNFKEHRKDVKKKLEELGYIVSYRRDLSYNGWLGDSYHNVYEVTWEQNR